MMRRSIATILAALLVVVAFPNAWGQSAGTGSTPIVKIRTLQIDAWARPGVGQFVPADDGVQHLAYELFVTSWHYTKDLRFAAVDVEDASTSATVRGPNSCDPVPHVYRSYWLSGYARDGKPDPAKRRRIDFKVPTDGSFMTFPFK